uniref:Heavy metal translocating P-type ATPase metal-binding domain-containing protein n=1 Tax=Roseihalotalea indica TaxID=2867963 RepID=A0AA49GJP9_9BACT|nr:heavy metal translocating P-type ATPase metal-binding domain-containing protein [Tunicatimonas sp. TK19036]
MNVTDTKMTCFHCGEDCRNEPIVLHEKPFCCEGCKTVYEILNSSELCEYYELEKAPGTTQKQPSTQSQYAFLDQESIAQSLLDFQEGTTAKITLYIPSVHCSSCIWLLENLFRLHEGIHQSRVQFLKKEVSITFYTDQISLREIAELLSSLGYAPDISLASAQAKKPEKGNKNNKSLAIKTGIAGFCFGNAMLLSLPEYLDSRFLLEASYRQFFGYLNLLLALPVFFYAANGYFTSAWKGLSHRYINLDVPISLGILALFGRSAYEILTHTGTGYVDSLNGLVFFLLIGQWYQSKTYQALSYERDYASYFPVSVTKLVNDQEITTPLHSLEVGDRVLLRNHELIPADSILLKGHASIDYSFVTGESEPISKQSGDLLYAGGRQMGSSLVIEVQKPVASSYLTQLWNQSVFQKSPTASLTSLANNVSRYFTLAILLISVGTALYWYEHDRSMLLNAVTSVLIVACPCALALSIPFAYGHTLRIFGKQGLYLKNADVVEKMAKIDHIIFDKTGTITQAQPQELPFVGESLSVEEKAMLRSVVRNSSHPLSQAIYHSINASLPLKPLRAFEEQPGLGIVAQVDGNQWKVGAASWVTPTPQADTRATRVYVNMNEQVKGYYEFNNQYRAGFTELMLQLHPHYTTHLVSGDQDQTKKALVSYFDHLHFRQSPMDKLNYVKQLEQQGHLPMMIGDGLNDAGALKQSYVGIAVADNVYHFSPACDAILSAPHLSRVGSFLRLAKASEWVVKAAFLLSFVYNAIGISFAVSGLLTPLLAAILMPLSSVTVVGFITLAIYQQAHELNLTDTSGTTRMRRTPKKLPH